MLAGRQGRRRRRRGVGGGRRSVAAGGGPARRHDAPPDVESETVAVEQAQSAFDRATAALADLEARTGPIVPLGEIVFVNALPATVSTLNAEVGQAVGEQATAVPFEPPDSGALAVLATAGLQVEAFVAPSDADLVQVGMDVELLDEISSDTVAATLTSLGEQVESAENGETRGFRAVIEAVDDLPREWTGRNVRVTFTAAATEGEVLVVPVAALSSGGDGAARVEMSATTAPSPLSSRARAVRRGVRRGHPARRRRRSKPATW